MKRALVFACVAVSACGSSPPPQPKTLTDAEFVAQLSAEQKTASSTRPLFSYYDAAGAADVCQQFVLDRLKAPASAKFPNMTDAVLRDLGHGKFRIHAPVDSQNSFGALVRNDYDCAVHWREGAIWVLDGLKLTSR